MKLYAKTTSERDSRPAKKGGNEFLITQLWIGNTPVGKVMIEQGEIKFYFDEITAQKEKLSITLNNYSVIYQGEQKMNYKD